MLINVVKAVIIDIDDTLCLTETARFAMENEVLRLMGRPPMERALHKATWGKPLAEAIPLRSPGIDMDQFRTLFMSLLDVYIQNGKLDVIPKANYRALDELKAHGKSIMVLTSRTHAEVRHMMRPDHPLASRVTAYYYRDNLQFYKPNPRVFDALLQTYGLASDQCVYVGDTISDALASNAAGIKFIASLESGLQTKQAFARYKVDAFIHAFPELVAAVRLLE